MSYSLNVHNKITKIILISSIRLNEPEARSRHFSATGLQSIQQDCKTYIHCSVNCTSYDLV